jgi:hypothetical protein
MPHYYCYALNAAGHVKAREIMTAEDEHQVIEQAKAYLRAHQSIPAIEVWLAERRIRKLWQASHPSAVSDAASKSSGV